MHSKKKKKLCLVIDLNLLRDRVGGHLGAGYPQMRATYYLQLRLNLRPCQEMQLKLCLKSNKKSLKLDTAWPRRADAEELKAKGLLCILD